MRTCSGSTGASALLITHAGTLFSLFVANIRVTDLRPFERRIPDLLTAALLDEGRPTDALGRLEPSEVRLAKTAAGTSSASRTRSRSRSAGTQTGPGASRTSTSTCSTTTCAAACTNKDGDYRIPLDLVHQRPRAAGNDLSPTTGSTKS
jgi:hypothetical protein